jgi:hypothetical protein
VKGAKIKSSKVKREITKSQIHRQKTEEQKRKIVLTHVSSLTKRETIVASAPDAAGLADWLMKSGRSTGAHAGQPVTSVVKIALNTFNLKRVCLLGTIALGLLCIWSVRSSLSRFCRNRESSLNQSVVRPTQCERNQVPQNVHQKA